MKKNFNNLKYSTIYNDSSLNELKSTYFPSLTHKELLSIHDMKLKTNYDLKSKVLHNFHRNFHSEIMKSNLKENSKYSTLYKDSSTYAKTETKFPSLQRNKNETVVKFNMNPKIFNSLMNKSVNKKVNINYRTIFNNISLSKKYNTSYNTTSGNVSQSKKSPKFSTWDKMPSNSQDFNGSLFNFEKSENSLERIIKTQKSIDNSSFSFQNQQKYINTETLNNNSTETKYEFNKKFVSSMNPLYSSFKKEIISQFYMKNKDINYLKFLLMKNKKDIIIQEERRASEMERVDQALFTIKTVKNLFNKYHISKTEYLNYLQKEISKEKEKNEVLKEEKITLMKDIYIIRHKTLRLENRFKNYLDDKFFLLSVKNHSFKLDKFDQEDRDDYKRDLEKLEILNFMIKLSSNEFSETEFSRDNQIRATRLFKKHDLININMNIPSPIRNNTRSFLKENTLCKSSNKMVKINNMSYSPLKRWSNKRISSTNFETKPIYDDVYYFNKDLQETTKKIQDSLDEYNNLSKDINIIKKNLEYTKKEMKDIRDYELHSKDEIILFKKRLENLKKLNIGLFNYKKYLQNISILNLNQGKVFEKINLIMENIEKSKDNNLLDFIAFEFNDYNTYINTGLDKLRLIESVFQYLITFKLNKQEERNEKYFEIQREIDEHNRKKLCQRKQDVIKNKFDSLIQKVIDKNKKIIFVPRRKVDKNMHGYMKKNRTQKIENNGDDYFGQFDIF